jgi:hypothetical protein
MSKQFDIDIAMKGKDQGAAGAVDKLTQKLRALKAETKNERVLTKFLGAGADKQFETIGSLLGGAKFGLAAFAIDKGAESVKHMAEEAKKLKEEFAEGKVNARDIVDRVAGAIPVFGQVYQATQAVMDLFSDEVDQTERVNKSLEQQKKHLEDMNRIVREGKSAVKSWADDVARATMPHGAPSGSQEAIDQAQERAKMTVDQINDKFKRDAKETDEFGDKGELPKLREQLQKAEAKKNQFEKDFKDKKANLSDIFYDPKAEAAAEQAHTNWINQAAAVDDLKNKVKTLESTEGKLAQQRDKLVNNPNSNGQEEVKKATEDWMKARRAAEVQKADAVEDLNSENRAKELEQAGDNFGAEIERIRHEYDKKISATEDGEERMALAKQEALEEQKVHDEAYQSGEEQRARQKEAFEKQRDEDQAAGADKQIENPNRNRSAVLTNSGYQGLAEQARERREMQAQNERKQQTMWLSKIHDKLGTINASTATPIVLT